MSVRPILAALLALLSFQALAENTPALAKIAVAEVAGDALDRAQASELRDLIALNAARHAGVKIVDIEGRPDYQIAAKASRVEGKIGLMIDITKIATSERRSVIEVFPDVDSLFASSPRLTKALIERGFGTAGTAEDGPFDPKPRLSAIAGSWEGDKGIAVITLQKDGRGFALLESGARMALKAAVSGSYVIISQDQPNSPDFYRPDLDPRAAAAVSAAARRWTWVFSLSADGEALRGFKESVFVRVDESGAVSVDNDYSREAVWTRRPR